jgi:hypothetical protein
MDGSAILLSNGSLRIKRTRHGLLAYNINDIYIGRSLELYGEWSPDEASLLPQFANAGSVVVDVGANIGAITVVLSQVVGTRGVVVAIEPQRAIYQLLCQTLRSMRSAMYAQFTLARDGRKAARLCRFATTRVRVTLAASS